jgi:PAS domain S-box-containing protein
MAATEPTGIEARPVGKSTALVSCNSRANRGPPRHGQHSRKRRPSQRQQGVPLDMVPATLSTVSDEPFLRLLFQQSPGFMAVVSGPDHIFTDANPAYLERVGNRPILGLSIREALPEQIGQGYLEALDKVRTTGAAFVGRKLPTVIRGLHGFEHRWVDFVYQPLFSQARGHEKEVVGIFIQGSDVTEHVKAEEALLAAATAVEEQRHLFDIALSSMSDFAYILDGDCRLVYVNRPLLELWGRSNEDAIGKTFAELDYEPALANRLDAEIRSVFSSRQCLVGRTEYTNPLGLTSWYEYIFNPAFAMDRTVQYVVGTTRDIGGLVVQQEHVAHIMEAERAARIEAERVTRLKEEFAATISHELRTPLNAVVGWATLLQTGKLSQDMTEQAVAKIIRNVRLQSRLISDLLDVSGMVNGKLQLVLETLSLNSQVEEALDTVRLDAQAKEITLTFEASPEVDLVADSARIQQVIWNLLGNAIKFTPRGGKVSVSTRTDEATVTISVIDSGPGVPPEFVPHLFDRFSQSDSSSSRQHGGLGLGLSIVKSVVELHGGRVHVVSEPGFGAQFDVTLPIRRDKRAAAERLNVAVEKGVQDALTLDGFRILVVDDAEDGRDLVRRILETAGAQVATTASAAAALVLLATFEPHLLVSDVGMPEMDGYELIQRVRELPGLMNGVPAIALTAFARPVDVERARLAGFTRHVAKPADPAMLIFACQAAVVSLGSKPGALAPVDGRLVSSK